MMECYLFAVSRGSSLDTFTSRWTLFALTHRIIVSGKAAPTPANPISTSCEAHAHWIVPPEDQGSEVEFRLITCIGSSELVHENIITFKAEKNRVRYRITNLKVVGVGDTLLKCEWRKKGESNWQRAEVFWPIVVEFKEKPAAIQTAKSLED